MNMETTQEKQISYHYHGDRIRILFVLTGLMMVSTLPVFNELVSVPITVSIISIVALAVLGGFLNPAQKWIIYVDTIVAVLAFIAFEYYAVYTYMNLSLDVPLHFYFYWINQIMAVFFFLAIYLSVKTVRGRILAK